MSVRVKLPTHLRRLARVDGEISVDVAEPVTLAAVLDAVESLHPELQTRGAEPLLVVGAMAGG
jgi:molybdopterin converting factor small subunit